MALLLQSLLHHDNLGVCRDWKRFSWLRASSAKPIGMASASLNQRNAPGILLSASAALRRPRGIENVPARLPLAKSCRQVSAGASPAMPRMMAPSSSAHAAETHQRALTPRKANMTASELSINRARNHPAGNRVWRLVEGMTCRFLEWRVNEHRETHRASIHVAKRQLPCPAREISIVRQKR